jgi:hypothetical protein
LDWAGHQTGSKNYGGDSLSLRHARANKPSNELKNMNITQILYLKFKVLVEESYFWLLRSLLIKPI